MVSTSDLFALAVLDELLVSDVSNAPSAEDVAKIKERVPTIFAELSARGIYYVNDADDIPDEAFESLVPIVAYRLRRLWGVSGQMAIELKVAADEGMANLETISRTSAERNGELTVDTALLRKW